MTGLDTRVPGMGLLAMLEVCNHALTGGLSDPKSMDLGDDRIAVWVDLEGADQWMESIHIDAEYTRPTTSDDRELVYIDGRTPLQGIKIQLRFSRPVVQAVSHLRAVTA